MLVKLPVHIETVSSHDTADVYEQDGTFLCMARDRESAEAIARALNEVLVGELRGTADAVSLPEGTPKELLGPFQAKTNPKGLTQPALNAIEQITL